MMNASMMFTRSVTGLASTILMALYASSLQGHPELSIDELVTWTASNDDYIRKSMDTLQSMGLVSLRVGERNAKYYRLADSMQQFLPGFVPVLPAQSSVNSSFLKSETGAKVIDESVLVEPENAEKNGENTSSFLKSEGQNGFNQLIDDDDQLNLFNNNSSSSSIMNPKIKFLQPAKEHVLETRETVIFDQLASFPTLEKLFESMELLFGDRLDVKMFAPDLAPQLALAWICKAYFDAQRNPAFKNPVGLIRKRLAAKEQRKISRLEEMPDDFLEAIGLWEGRCAICSEGFRTRQALHDHLADGHCEDDEHQADAGESVDLGEVGFDIFPAWEQVLRELSQEMPRASYESWVRDTRPLGWQDEIGRLVIGTRNAYACDWLQKRMSVIQGHLSKISDRKLICEFRAVTQ